MIGYTLKLRMYGAIYTLPPPHQILRGTVPKRKNKNNVLMVVYWYLNSQAWFKNNSVNLVRQSPFREVLQQSSQSRQSCLLWKLEVFVLHCSLQSDTGAYLSPNSALIFNIMTLTSILILFSISDQASHVITSIQVFKIHFLVSRPSHALHVHNPPFISSP